MAGMGAGGRRPWLCRDRFVGRWNELRFEKLLRRPRGGWTLPASGIEMVEGGGQTNCGRMKKNMYRVRFACASGQLHIDASDNLLSTILERNGREVGEKR